MKSISYNDLFSPEELDIQDRSVKSRSQVAIDKHAENFKRLRQRAKLDNEIDSLSQSIDEWWISLAG